MCKACDREPSLARDDLAGLIQRPTLHDGIAPKTSVADTSICGAWRKILHLRNANGSSKIQSLAMMDTGPDIEAPIHDRTAPTMSETTGLKDSV